MKRKIISVLLSAVTLVAGLTSCSDGVGDTYEIGICQLDDHPSLNAATEGFKAALTEKLGGKVKFTEKNAEGSADASASICKEFAESEVDLILANATDALAAAASATDDIPIIATSVTDFAVALGMDSLDGTSGRNISGTSDMIPVADQASMVAELFPSAEYPGLGILYCSDEANSKYQSETLTPMFTALGYTVTEYTFTGENDIAAVTQTACENSDVLFIPTDNTAAKLASTVNSTALPLKTPIITGDESICTVCGVVTLGIDYTELGRKAGLQAYEVLVEGADISKMEIGYADKSVKKYNPEICAELGITVPEGYIAIDTVE